MKLQSRDNYVLSTGRVIYANQGIIGLRPVPVGPWETRLTNGYDSDILQGAPQQDMEDDQEWLAANPEQRILTDDERKEIAEYQIALWRDWAGMDADLTQTQR